MNQTSRWNLVLIPAIITLAVTLLRLYGELQGWSETFFGTEAGGGMAIVGITWLVPIFGFYFGWKLTQSGEKARSLARVGLMALGGILVVVVAAVVGSLIGPLATLVGMAVGSLIGIAIVRSGWPELVDALILYGVLARVPVLVVMFLAFQGSWGTHYDAIPPEFGAMELWEKFFFFGVVPQLTFWIFFTAAFGAIFALAAAALAGRKQATASV